MGVFLRHYFGREPTHVAIGLQEANVIQNSWCGRVSLETKSSGLTFSRLQLQVSTHFTIRYHLATSYMQMLQTNVIPCLESKGILDGIWWQQDGAPPHYASVVRNYLNQKFGSHWIGRGGPVEWPPRSPDINPLDFFLWGYLKRRVYRNRPASLEELKMNIVNECRTISSETLERVAANCLRRMLLCKENSGGHFEHLLH